MNRNRKKLSNEGALEGLPLYLILLVVIAGVGTAIIVGWMTGAQSTELDSIELSDNTIKETKRSVTVTAYDRNGNFLEGVTVTLEGCGVVESETTDEDGEASFNFNINLPENQNFGEIDVTARYSGDVTITRTAVITVTAE